MSISGSVSHACSILDAVLSNTMLSDFISDSVCSIRSSILLCSSLSRAVVFFLAGRSMLLCCSWIFRSVARCCSRTLSRLLLPAEGGVIVRERERE